MAEIYKPIEFPAVLVPEDEHDNVDPPATPQEIADFEDELRAIERAEADAANDYDIVLG